MPAPVLCLAGSTVTALLEALPAPLRPRVVAPGSPPPGPGVLVVEAVAGPLAEAARLQGVNPDLAVVVLVGASDAPAVEGLLPYACLPARLPAELLARTLAAACAHAARSAGNRTDLARLGRELGELTAIGMGLSSERPPDDLLERILTKARALTQADAGSLYLVERDGEGARRLRSRLVQNDSLPLSVTEFTVPIGSDSVAGHVALTGLPLALDDAYAPPPGSPFRIDPAFDRRTGYRTRSMLVVPMRTPAGEILGVLQLINRKADPARRFASAAEIEREVEPFPPPALDLVGALASLAAVALENARLYAELREALAAVEASQERVIRAERLRALGEMAGGVAHDFNNVLAVVLGRAQLLLREVAEPGLRRQLEVIERVAQDGAQTVRRIQEFARMRRTRPLQRVDLTRLVGEVVEATRPRWAGGAQAQGVTYEVRVDARPVPDVVGEPAELRETLTNLLFNAFDAMPAGGRLELATGVEGDRVCVRVTDTGVGMSEAVRRRVFEPFFTTKAEHGTGLGLSIAYGIVSRHGGEIEVSSAPGAGSTFVVWLPAGVVDAPPAGPAPPVATRERSGRLLVIEDEARVREVLVETLTRHGHTVAACADGRAGLARLAAEPFDLVLVDLSLPGLSGWEVVSAAGRRDPAPAVVLVTGWGDQIDPEEARARGALHVIPKPFDLADLVRVVDGVLAAR